MSEYDEHIAVRPGGSPTSWEAELTGGWAVGGGLNGGYQLSVLGHGVRAALAELSADDKPDPVTVSAYYLSPATAGPATVEVTPRRLGRGLATVAADLRQGDDTRITALATYGDLSTLGDPDDVRTTAEPVVLPPREECISNEHAPPEVREMAPLMDRFDMLFPPDGIGWAAGRPSGRGELGAWFRLTDREPDVLSLLTVVDALPPVTFDLGMMGWAPTLELTVHLRARPAPGWLRVRHRTRNLAGGMFEEDCEVWDERDRLVAQSRQLARVPR